jgi:hypothetical protein
MGFFSSKVKQLPAPLDPEQEKAAKLAEFEKNAWDIAVQSECDVHDVKAAYADKPEGLKQVFNAMTAAKEARNENIAWAIAALVFIPILTPLPAYFAYKRQQELEGVGKQVKFEIERFKALPPPEPKPALPPPSPGLI